VRSGLDPLELREPRNDGRWQRGELVGAVYLADGEDTVWAEWYRALAEAALPPKVWLPCELWRIDVDLDEVADLSDEERLGRVDLPLPEPDRRTWPPYQDIGDALFAEGCAAVIAPSAARPNGLVLCVFEQAGQLQGLTALDGPTLVAEPPPPPRGMRT
jgi:RES domain-containing protein